MFRAELDRVFKKKINIVLMVIMILIPFIDLGLNFYVVYHDYFADGKEALINITTNDILHPTKAAWLSSSSPGHIVSMVLLWLLPIYFLILHSDSYLIDKQLQYHQIIHTKISKKDFIKSKLLFAFLFGFMLFMTINVVNFIFANILFSSGMNFQGIELYPDPSAKLLNISLSYPIPIYIVYMFITSIIVGIYNVVITSASFVINKKKTLYATIIILWLMLWMFKYNISYVMQPFIEFGFDYYFITLAIYLALCFCIITISVIIFMRNDEI